MKNERVTSTICGRNGQKRPKNLYRLGWDERNGGNISYLLKEEEILPFLNPTQVLRKIPMKFDATKLAREKYFYRDRLRKNILKKCL